MKTYWRLLSFARPLRRYTIPYLFYTLLHALFNTFTFVMIMPIVDMLFTKPEMVAVTNLPSFELSLAYMEQLIGYLIYLIYGTEFSTIGVLTILAVALIIIALLSNLFRFLGQWTVELMKINTLEKLRNETYNNVLGLQVGFFTNERKGDIMSRIMSDVQVVQFCITNTLQVIFRDPFLIIFYIVAMVSISPELSLFAVVYLPVVALIIGSIVKRLRKKATRAQRSFGDLTSVLDESLSGMKTIKGYNAEGFFGSRFKSINGRYSHISRRMARRQQLASPMSEFLGIAAAAGILVFGGMLVINGRLDAAEFVAYIAIFSQITRPMRSFTDAFANINQGIAAGERVLSLLDTPPAIKDDENAVEIREFKDSIEFRDVRFSYAEREVIGGVSFKVNKGETVALVGPSGGGKSTLSDLIPRFYDVSSGAILIDGHDIREYKIASLRSLMGVVAQETILFNDSIENNIRLGNETATEDEIRSSARVANAEGFIEECDGGFEANIGDRGGKLSGGQRQRLSIARAVLKNPEILILDEATSALDTESERLVQDALDQLLAGRTSIVIAHRLSTIRNADKILVIDGGKIVEEGTHDELLHKKGVYARLIQLQQLG